MKPPCRFIPFSEPGFTKRNELNLGRLAMLGFGAGIIVEVFTGKGPLGLSLAEESITPTPYQSSLNNALHPSSTNNTPFVANNLAFIELE